MTSRFDVEKRTLEALELATTGLSYEEIARRLHYANRSGAWKAVMRGLRWRTRLAADTYRVSRLESLNQKQASVWSSAMRGNVRSTQVALRCVDERIFLLSDAEVPAARKPKRETSVAMQPDGCSSHILATAPSSPRRSDQSADEEAVVPILITSEELLPPWLEP